MMIKIVLPQGNGIRTACGTKVYTMDGVEIENIMRISLDLTANDVMAATLEIAVDDIENFEYLRAQLKEMEKISRD